MPLYRLPAVGHFKLIHSALFEEGEALSYVMTSELGIGKWIGFATAKILRNWNMNASNAWANELEVAAASNRN